MASIKSCATRSVSLIVAPYPEASVMSVFARSARHFLHAIVSFAPFASCNFQKEFKTRNNSSFNSLEFDATAPVSNADVSSTTSIIDLTVIGISRTFAGNVASSSLDPVVRTRVNRGCATICETTPSASVCMPRCVCVLIDWSSFNTAPIRPMTPNRRCERNLCAIDCKMNASHAFTSRFKTGALGLESGRR